MIPEIGTFKNLRKEIEKTGAPYTPYKGKTLRDLLFEIGRKKRTPRTLGELRADLRRSHLTIYGDLKQPPLDAKIPVFLHVRALTYRAADSKPIGKRSANDAIPYQPSAAFMAVLTEIEDTLKRVRNAGKEAFERGDNAAVEVANQEMKEILTFRERVTSLSNEWSRLQLRTVPNSTSRF